MICFGRGYRGYFNRLFTMGKIKEKLKTKEILVSDGAWGTCLIERGLQAGETIFCETPEEMAGKVHALIDAGANIIGGCCGTTAAHIASIKKSVDEYMS